MRLVLARPVAAFALAGLAAGNHATLVYDVRRDRAVLFGGHDGTHVFGETWEWDGARWHAVRTKTPERRVDNGH